MSWVDHLVCWFTEYKRSLPWRESNDAYAVWVSEIMLQQTRIEAVLGYYQRFMQAFPTVEALAGAPLERVLKLWEGLGYYSRARNLHKAAQQIVERGGFPRTSAELQTLAGIGEYTAGAIAAIAFGEPALAIDGNVMRVVSRLYALEEDVLLASSRKHVKELLLQVYPKNRASDFVQGLMELGELVCIPKPPRCERCPLQTDCQALARGLQTKLPLRVPMVTPSSGVNPMEVSIDLPLTTAAIELPLPRWQVIILELLMSSPVNLAPLAETYLWLVPWNPYLRIRYLS